MKKEMIKVSVFYPNEEGKTFDMDYYCNTHFPLVEKLLGDKLKGAAIEKGLMGAKPGSPTTFIAIGNMYFDSMEDFGAAFGPNAAVIGADVPNFTSIKPTMQVSEVMK